MTNTMAYVANEVRGWILDGLIVERIPTEDVRMSWGLCPHVEHQLDMFSEEQNDDR